jgi:hypothetical protein
MFMYGYLTLCLVPEKTSGLMSQVKINLTAMMLINCNNSCQETRRNYEVQDGIVQILNCEKNHKF